MSNYNFGTVSKVVGLGTVAYGIITKDMEAIAGGAVIAYIGKTMVDSELKDQRNSILERRNVIEERRNTILKDRSLDNKLE